MEIWKYYEGLEISNLGNFKLNGIELKQYVQRYLFVMDANKKIKSSHRLVAKCWIPNPENKPQVNHIDGNKTNNNINNLEWCTASENMIHAIDNGLQIEPKGVLNKHYGKRGKETIRAKKVIDTQTGIIYDCLKDAYLSTGFSYKNVSRQLTGNRSNRTTLKYL